MYSQFTAHDILKSYLHGVTYVLFQEAEVLATKIIQLME